LKTLFFFFTTYLTTLAYGSISPKSQLDLTTAKNSVEFLAVGNPSAVKIRGTMKNETNAPALKGQLLIDGNNITGETSFRLESLDTGIDLRTKHMKEKYLETQKFPLATLKLKKLELPEPFTGQKLSKKDLPFAGGLTLHGVTHDLTGTANFEGQGTTTELRRPLFWVFPWRMMCRWRSTLKGVW
jgi:hypothetical protein